MLIFYNPSKIMKLVSSTSIINEASKRHIRMPQMVFNQNTKGLGKFISMICA